MPRGPARALAFALPCALPLAPPTPASHTTALAFPADLLHTRLVDRRIVTRFVVAFDESGSTSGRVPTHTLAGWMGRLRELALTAIAEPLRARLATGRDGMVTQDAWARLTGEATALDRIEATNWVEDLRPNSCTLRFRFERIDAQGNRWPVGEAGQRFGWVEIVGHGQVRTAPFPEFLQVFLDALYDGSAAAPARPLVLPTAPAIETLHIRTSSVDSNVVGNLYYAGYFKWAARVVDRLLERHAPSMVRASGREGEVAITSLRLEHLREAMPFDELEAALYPAPTEGDDLAWLVVFQRRVAHEPVRLAIGRVGARRLGGGDSLDRAMQPLSTSPPRDAR